MSMTTGYSLCPRSIVLGKTGLCVQDEIGLAKDTVQPAGRLSKMIKLEKKHDKSVRVESAFENK